MKKIFILLFLFGPLMHAADELGKKVDSKFPQKISYEEDLSDYIKSHCSLVSNSGEHTQDNLKKRFDYEHGLENAKQEFGQWIYDLLLPCIVEPYRSDVDDRTDKTSRYLQHLMNSISYLKRFHEFPDSGFYTREYTKFKQKKYEEYLQRQQQ